MAPAANTQTREVECSIIFVEKALALLDLLRDVDQVPGLYSNKTLLRSAIRRYERCWIPLMKHYSSDQQLEYVPPLDVKWVCFAICWNLTPTENICTGFYRGLECIEP